MNRLVKTLALSALVLTTTSVFATPQLLITHNNTPFESNAYVSGIVPSTHPSKPMSVNQVSWVEVKMACFGRSVAGKCTALIKMETNTPHPVDLGYVTMDLKTGEITPSKLSANGYTMVVNGLAETTLTKD